MVYTPRAKIAAVVHDIVSTIGVTGGERAKLAFILGPISFDHTDAEARQILIDGFEIALAENIAVGFRLDDAMFWSNRTDLIGTAANEEWTDFSGALSTGLLLDWAHPPANADLEVASIVAEFVGLWTSGLAEAGIEPTRIYTHVNFLTKATFATLEIPPGVTYETLVNMLPSSQHPSVAFAANSRPGFSTYPGVGLFDQIQEELSQRGAPAWASSEGTNLLPPSGDSGLSMETYLARCFNHGATLVDIYGWGIGGPSSAETSPFRIATQGPEALETYREFLAQ